MLVRPVVFKQMVKDVERNQATQVGARRWVWLSYKPTCICSAPVPTPDLIPVT